MEKLIEELKDVDLKQASLRKLVDEVHAQCKTALRFTVESKDLESHFDSIRSGLLEQAKELVEDRDKVRIREIEAENGMKKVQGFFKEMGEQKQLLILLKGEVFQCQSELGSLQNKVKSCTEDLQGKRRELGIAQGRLDEIHEEIAVKEVEHCRKLKLRQKEVEEVEKKFSDCTRQLKLKDKELNELIIAKERRLDELDVRTRNRCEELGLKEKELDELSFKVDSTKLLIEDFNEELEKKELKFDEVNMSVQEKEKQLVFLGEIGELINKEKEKLDRVNEAVKTSMKNLALKQAELSEIQSSIDIGSNHLTAREKLIEQLHKELEQVRQQNQLSTQALVEIFSHALECNDVSLSKWGMKLESRMVQLSSIQSKLLECNKRLAAEKQKLEKHVEQIKLREEELDSEQKLLEERCAAVEEKEKQVNNRAEALQPSCVASVVESSIQGGNGRNLQSVLNEHFKRHDLLMSEVWTSLQKSPDPAKLVLDGLFGFHPNESKSSGEYELSVVRKSCIVLLELLSRISAQMKPQVSEESMQLARGWQAKLGTAPAANNSLKVLGLVKLISAFRLPLSLKHSLVKSVNQHMKVDVKDEWGAFASADILVGSFIFSSTRTAEGHMSVTTTSYNEDSYPQLLQDEPLPSELSPNEVTTCLETSPDPATMVFSLIRDSIVQHESGSIKPCDENVQKFLALLLQQLMSMQPFVDPCVKEEAAKVAVTWRGSLRMEAIDILAFLLFLGTYRVTSHFEQEDIINLAGIIANYKRAPELWIALGLEEKVPGLIKSLIKKDKHIEAARFSIAFRLVDDYPPNLILLKILEKRRTFESGKLLLESQCEAFNKHMNFLKQLIQRVKEFDFDRSLLNAELLKHFQDLARLLQQKTNCLRVVAASIGQPQRQSGVEHHHGATGVILPGYPTVQSSAAVQYTTPLTQQQQQSWIWQSGDLNYQAQRNKRARTSMQ
ncbi:FRIGIDA-like protein 1 [Linum perenne]